MELDLSNISKAENVATLAEAKQVIKLQTKLTYFLIYPKHGLETIEAAAILLHYTGRVVDQGKAEDFRVFSFCARYQCFRQARKRLIHARISSGLLAIAKRAL